MNSNLVANRNFNGKIPLFNNLFQSCPPNQPFFTGTVCVACSLPSYFDFTLKTCTTCDKGLVFNVFMQSCEYVEQSYYSRLDVGKIYFNGNF